MDLYGNPGALHKEAVEAKKELEKSRKSIADSVGAHADEIVFTASGTEGNNLSVQGLLRPLLQERGEIHAITSSIEHQSILEPLRALEREGLYLTELPVNNEGLIDPKELAEAINEQTAFISIQLVNSEVGTIEPLREIAKELRRARQGASPNRQTSLKNSGVKAPPLFFHTDASQAPLWLKLNVGRLHADLMTLDGQKVLGPKGVGALYIKRGTPIEPLMRGGRQERGLRGGTENVPLAGAFAVALADAQSGVEERVERVSAVRDRLWDEIKKLIPDAVLNGPRVEASPRHRVANNLNISIPNLDAEMAVLAMDAEGVAVSTRSACNVGEEEPSHVITALLRSDLKTGPQRSDLWRGKTAIRITLLPDANASQARRIAATLADVAYRYRQT